MPITRPPALRPPGSMAHRPNRGRPLCSLPIKFRRVWADYRIRAFAPAVDITSCYRSDRPSREGPGPAGTVPATTNRTRTEGVTMRIRTILTAAAAPAALAAILLGTAGQASAQVAPPAQVAPAQAALTASAKQATISANTHVHNVADTTNVSGDHTGTSDNGPVWAYDNLERKITATQTGTDTWAVRIDSQGSFNAIANPLDGNVWTG